MTAVRWVVDFPQDQLGTGGWIEYPDERTARAHAGTAATVWALVIPEAAAVLRTAVTWRRNGSVADQFALNVAIDAYAPRALDQQETP